MPIGLVWVGGILVALVGVLVFLLIQRQKPSDPPHLRWTALFSSQWLHV